MSCLSLVTNITWLANRMLPQLLKRGAPKGLDYNLVLFSSRVGWEQENESWREVQSPKDYDTLKVTLPFEFAIISTPPLEKKQESVL